MHEISLVTFKDKIAQYFTLDFRIYFLTEYTIFCMDFFFFWQSSLVWRTVSVNENKRHDIRRPMLRIVIGLIVTISDMEVTTSVLIEATAGAKKQRKELL